MGGAEKRRHDRVDTNVRVKLPGDLSWTKCTTSNTSSGSLLFNSARHLPVGDLVTLQFMLQSKTGTLANVYFFASAPIVRIIRKNDDSFQIAGEVLVDEDLRKEINKRVNIIQGQNMKIDRTATRHAVFDKIKP